MMETLETPTIYHQFDTPFKKSTTTKTKQKKYMCVCVFERMFFCMFFFASRKQTEKSTDFSKVFSVFESHGAIGKGFSGCSSMVTLGPPNRIGRFLRSEAWRLLLGPHFSTSFFCPQEKGDVTVPSSKPTWFKEMFHLFSNREYIFKWWIFPLLVYRRLLHVTI